jgi:hypothetical protein
MDRRLSTKPAAMPTILAGLERTMLNHFHTRDRKWHICSADRHERVRPLSAITWHCHQPRARQTTNAAAPLGHPCDAAA